MKLSAAEYEIMECVWALGRDRFRHRHYAALGQEKGWKQPTVLTFLSRLVEKACWRPKSAASCAAILPQ